MADRRMEIRIELPARLVDMFHGEGNVNELLAQALKLGMTEQARPGDAAPADAEDPALRKQQALTNLIHFFGRYWYLTLRVARLTREVRRLEGELEALADPGDEEQPVRGNPDVVPPDLIEVAILVDQTVLDEAARFFVRNSTSDPAATAITFGAALVLLRKPLARASTEEILREVGRYWSGVASLQFRAYALGHDKQVLAFRLAAQRAEMALRKRLQS